MYVSLAQVFSFQAKFSVSTPYVCISAFFPPPPQPPTHSYPPSSVAATICSALPRSSRSYQVNHQATSLPHTICVHGSSETPSFIHILTPYPKESPPKHFHISP